MSRPKTSKCQSPLEDCPRTDIYGRGLCGKHYQRYKLHGILDEVAPLVHDPCEWCGGPVESSKYNTRMCSNPCRQAAKYARMAGPRLNKNCLHCGKPLTTQKRDAKWCDEVCGHLGRSGSTRMPDEPRFCGVCDNPLGDHLTPWHFYCSPVCSRIAIGITNAKRRAQKLTATVESVNRLRVAENDKWICQICFYPIDPKAKFRTPEGKWNPGYLHMDHKIPLSRGGEHSYVNCQASHARCNLRKNNRIFVDGEFRGGRRRSACAEPISLIFR